MVNKQKNPKIIYDKLILQLKKLLNTYFVLENPLKNNSYVNLYKLYLTINNYCSIFSKENSFDDCFYIKMDNEVVEYLARAIIHKIDINKLDEILPLKYTNEKKFKNHAKNIKKLFTELLKLLPIENKYSENINKVVEMASCAYTPNFFQKNNRF